MEHSKSREEVPREVSMKACQLEQGWQKETRSPTLECNEFGLTYSLCKILGWRNCHKKGMSNLMEGTSFFCLLKIFFLLTFNCFAMLCSFLLCRRLSHPLPLELPSHLLVTETLIASQKMHYCWASSKEIELHTPVFFTLFPEEIVYSLPINFAVLFCWAMGGTPPLPNDGRETVTWG